MINKYRISAIVPAYNEEHVIQGVLRILTKTSCIDEVICVDDGSTDGTATAICKFENVRVITNK
jgi:glycosyltransferase involved in cell wall biosynthesis